MCFCLLCARLFRLLFCVFFFSSLCIFPDSTNNCRPSFGFPFFCRYTQITHFDCVCIWANATYFSCSSCNFHVLMQIFFRKRHISNEINKLFRKLLTQLNSTICKKKKLYQKLFCRRFSISIMKKYTKYDSFSLNLVPDTKRSVNVNSTKYRRKKE